MNGHRRLAAAVLHQAFDDASTTRRSHEAVMWRNRALTFLTRPSPELAFWCMVAQVDPGAVIAAARKKFLRPKRKAA